MKLDPNLVQEDLLQIASYIDGNYAPSKQTIILALDSIVSSLEDLNEYVWMSEIGPYLVKAKDHDEAIRKIISNLIDAHNTMMSGSASQEESVSHALKSFNEYNDIIDLSDYSGSIEDEIIDPPYTGDISSISLPSQNEDDYDYENDLDSDCPYCAGGGCRHCLPDVF